MDVIKNLGYNILVLVIHLLLEMCEDFYQQIFNHPPDMALQYKKWKGKKVNFLDI